MHDTTLMSSPSRDAFVRFLGLGYAPDDWIGLLTKSSTSNAVVQRIVPVAWLLTRRAHAWLAALDRQRWHHYVTINAIAPRQPSRARRAVRQVRHLILDADVRGGEVVDRAARGRLPVPSYVIHSSRDRRHLLWRIRACSCEQAEALQRHLARLLSTDLAATSCAQLTRVIGSHNYKYRPAPEVAVEFVAPDAVYTPDDFPTPPAPLPALPVVSLARGRSSDLHHRVRRYLAAIEPAVTGQHGDRHTFQVCCRVVRGFALSDDEALALLADWNARCQPPWDVNGLRAKIRHARRYGREPIGGLLDHDTSSVPPASTTSASSTCSRLPRHAVASAARPPDAASTHRLQGRECPPGSPAPRQCSEPFPMLSISPDIV